jgi:hypothetical protein
MKSLYYLALIAVAICAPFISGAQGKPPVVTDSLFSHFDAERILGQSARMTEREISIQKESKIYKSAYSSIEKDEATGKQGNVHYMVEQFNDDLAAHKSFLAIKTASEKNGIQTINHLGREAYYQSDNENFHLIMVRKGAVVYRIKINKITSRTSELALNEVAKQIAEKI